MSRHRAQRLFPMRWRLALVLALFAGCAVVSVEQNPGNQADAYLAAHHKGEAKVRHQQFASDNATLAYVSVGEPGRPLVVFVHGTPGRWSDFVHFLAAPELQAQAYLVSLDRPGWGDSSPVQAARRVTLSMQSQLLAPFLQALAAHSDGCGMVLVGHSLGGSLVARLAMDYPQWVRGMVIIAGSIDPQLGRPRWYNTLASVPPVRWLTPKPLAQANTEIMPLHADLLAMAPGWADLDIPVTYIQGLDDRLVSPGNVQYARKVVAASQLQVREVPDQGHFLIWDQPQWVTEAISATLAQMRSSCAVSGRARPAEPAPELIPTRVP